MMWLDFVSSALICRTAMIIMTRVRSNRYHAWWCHIHIWMSQKRSKNAYNTCCSRVVPHPSTRQAQARLTSEFWWFRVHSYWYGRMLIVTTPYVAYIPNTLRSCMHAPLLAYHHTHALYHAWWVSCMQIKALRMSAMFMKTRGRRLVSCRPILLAQSCISNRLHRFGLSLAHRDLFKRLYNVSDFLSQSTNLLTQLTKNKVRNMQHDVIGFRFERVNLSYCNDHHDESAIESISCDGVIYTYGWAKRGAKMHTTPVVPGWSPTPVLDRPKHV